MILRFIKKAFEGLSFDIEAHWNTDKVGGEIKFPVIEFEFNGNGTINYYTSINDIIGSWSHSIGEDFIYKDEPPCLFVDDELIVYEIIFNDIVKVKEPKLIGKLSLRKFEELMFNAEIEYLNLTKETLNQLDVIRKKLKLI